jgi:hypothetical protein
MLMWAMGRFQMQPSEAFLQDVMACTLQLMPSMSLLSVVTLLGTFRDLQYLPPLPWMVEVCSAARAKLGSSEAGGTAGSTAGRGGTAPKKWQMRNSVRRFEEAVAWYNQAVQAEAAARGLSSSSASSSPIASLDGSDGLEEVTQQEMQRRRARQALLAAANPSEAMLAAAVGVAAAVAQSWHP